ncbi:MAG: type II toxin-antitoxin system VapC family toxin [Solirubrobacterales bacterium]
MIVADASVLLDLLLDRPPAQPLKERLAGERRLHAPHLVDTEVLHALRRWVQRGHLTPGRVEAALTSLADLPLVRWDHRPLNRRVWQLRETLTAYDATYVALTESLDATLASTDKRLRRAAARFIPIADGEGDR